MGKNSVNTGAQKVQSERFTCDCRVYLDGNEVVTVVCALHEVDNGSNITCEVKS